MFKRILVCADGSDQARYAAQAAAEIADRFRSQVTLLNVTLLSVFDPSSLLAPFLSTPEVAPETQAVQRLGETLHEAVLQATGTLFAERGVPYHSRLEIGHPVDKIVAVAQSLQADLIVMGSRGINEWKAPPLGGVADGVLHYAPCPVLIVRGEQTPFTRILMASDGSGCAYHATLTAAQLSEKFAAPLTILNVVESLGPLADLLGERAEALSRQVREMTAERIRRTAEQTGIAYTLRQEVGRPAETIVGYAEANAISLIVLGNHGLSAGNVMLLGSVSNRVAYHASCSVLIVR